MYSAEVVPENKGGGYKDWESEGAAIKEQSGSRAVLKDIIGFITSPDMFGSFPNSHNFRVTIRRNGKQIVRMYGDKPTILTRINNHLTGGSRPLDSY